MRHRLMVKTNSVPLLLHETYNGNLTVFHSITHLRANTLLPGALIKHLTLNHDSIDIQNKFAVNLTRPSNLQAPRWLPTLYHVQHDEIHALKNHKAHIDSTLSLILKTEWVHVQRGHGMHLGVQTHLCNRQYAKSRQCRTAPCQCMLQTTEDNSNMFRSFIHTWAKVLDAEMMLAQKAVLEHHSHY